ncbi:MAG: NAD-dependent epimerase/dehydratase family protein, partial [Chloroflexi bacterium]|nr:NAD-dependent epimerase/dehydratase family protein [Chloroflexota bacterium]
SANLQPQTPYAVSKLAAEQYVLAIGALWKIETVILRIFNAYGPGQPLPPSHAPVIPRFLRQVIGGGSVVIFGSGNQTRDYVYIDDVVHALSAAAQKPGLNRTVLNVGSGAETSIHQLLDTIEAAVGREAHRLNRAGDSGGISRLVANVQRAREVLGFAPQVALHEGLRQMVMKDDRFRLQPA